MKKLQKTKNLAYRTIEGKAYIVNTSTSTLHELNETGTYIWKLLDKNANESELCKKIVEEYEVSEQQAMKDIKDLLNSFKQNGLIE